MVDLVVGYEVYCGEGHLLVSADLFQNEHYWEDKCKENNTEYMFVGKIPLEVETRFERHITVLRAKHAAIKFDTKRVYDRDDGEVWFDLSILQETEAKEGFFQFIFDMILMNP